MRSLIVVLILIVAGLLPSPARGEDTELTLWHAYRGKERAALEQVCGQLEAKGYKVNLLPVPYDAYADKISAAIPRDRGPDLFIFGHDRIGDWAESDLLEPLDFWADDAVRGEYLPKTVEPLTYKGSLYGLPISFKSLLLYYNKNLVKTPPATTDTFIEIARQNTNAEEEKYGLVYEIGLLYYHAPWLFGFGGGLFGDDGEVNLYSKEAVAALTFAGDLQNKHKVLPVEISNTLVTMLFNRGDAAMAISGPWFMAEIEGVDYGIAPLPRVSATDKPAQPFLTAECVIISAKSKKKEAAWELARLLTTGEFSKRMALEGKQLPADKATINDPEVQKLPYLQACLDQLEHTVATPNIPEMRMVWTPYDTALFEVLNEKETPEAAMKKLQEQVAKDVREYRK